MIICKFGGTSVQDADALERVAGIIRQRLEEKPVVVSSAMGKTTNGLLLAAEIAAMGRKHEALDLLGRLREKHLSEMERLGLGARQQDLTETIDSHFREISDIVNGLAILGELTPRSMDAIASYGELLSTAILEQVLESRGVPSQLLDARQCMITDDQFTRAAPLFEVTNPAIRQRHHDHHRSRGLRLQRGDHRRGARCL